MIAKPVKVRRTSWRSLRQDVLLAYSENVVAQTTDAAYDPLRELLTELANLNKDYGDSLAAVINRDRAAVALKDDLKLRLYAALEKVAVGLEANAKGENLYVINAGMEVHRPNSVHTGELLPPFDLVATSTGLSGQAELRFKFPRDQRQQVETFAVEWRTNEEEIWKNGAYKNSIRILVEDLPSRKDLLFRVRGLGTRGRQSVWSEVAGTFVV